jgi:hypothetical protein
MSHVDVKAVALSSGLAVLGLAVAATLVTRRGVENRTSENQRRYQEITLKLSRDQSQLDRACRQRRVDIEQDRVTRFRTLPSARKAVGQYDIEAGAAKAKRENTIAQAHQRAALEGQDSDRVKEETQWIVDAAERAYQAEVVALTAGFVTVATALLEGVPIAADADRRANDVNAECHQRREELLADFRNARAELGVN